MNANVIIIRFQLIVNWAWVKKSMNNTCFTARKEGCRGHDLRGQHNQFTNCASIARVYLPYSTTLPSQPIQYKPSIINSIYKLREHSWKSIHNSLLKLGCFSSTQFSTISLFENAWPLEKLEPPTTPTHQPTHPQSSFCSCPLPQVLHSLLLLPTFSTVESLAIWRHWEKL